jgi:hypothetical protein
MSHPLQIEALLAQYADLNEIQRESAKVALRQHALEISFLYYRKSLRDQRPDLVEADLEELRKQIRAIVKRIQQLDSWTLSSVRTAKRSREIEAAGSDLNAIHLIIARPPLPKEEWPDKAAIRHLLELEEGLNWPIEKLIEKTRDLPVGKGAKPNLQARKVALAAGAALIALTGKPVSYWQGATAYAKLTEVLFKQFGIRADTRRPCEWALSELAKKD